MKNFMILVLALSVMSLTFVGCKNNPTEPTPACALCAQQTATEVAKVHQTETAVALAIGTATETNIVVVNTTTATATSTSTNVIVATATATQTSTDVVVLPTATATSSLSQYYVTVASLSSTESSFTAYVGVWNGNVIYPESSYSIQAPAPYYYVCTSDVVNTNSFHLQGICTTQAIRVRAYRNGVAIWGADVPANTPFGVSD